MAKAKRGGVSTYRSGWCITDAHDKCTMHYGNVEYPTMCTCKCHDEEDQSANN